MSNKEYTENDYSHDKKVEKQLEEKIEKFFQRRYDLTEENRPVWSEKQVKADDLKILSELSNSKFFINYFNKIISDYCRKYSQSNFQEYEEEVDFWETLFKTYSNVTKAYKPNNGRFINYFTKAFGRNVSQRIKNILIKKNKLKVESFDAPLNNSDSKSTLADVIQDKKNINHNDEEKKNIDILFSEIDKIYNKTKAGRKNKAIAYTSLVIDYLLTLTDEDLNTIISKYTFLQTQKENILYFFQDRSKALSHIPQNVFASVCNIDKVVLCRTCRALIKELQAYEELFI